MITQFIYAIKKRDFLSELSKNNITHDSIVFIEETKEIWNRGVYYTGDLSNYATTGDVQQLNNDLTKLVGDLRINIEQTYALKTSIPTKVSQLTNDAEYTTQLDLENAIPTKVSQLENDVPYVSQLEFDNKLAKTAFTFVDLGLPSGIKWATCNIGASNPTDLGLLFAWGETEGYNSNERSFDWTTYKFSPGVQVPNPWTVPLTKYNLQSEYGDIDNKSSLENVDDAAYQLDGLCRIPTRDDIAELIDNTTCSPITWGYRLTSNINGAFIDLYRNRDNDSSNFWSSSLGAYSISAYGFFADEPDGDGIIKYTAQVAMNTRCSGMPIRAVLDSTVDDRFSPYETTIAIQKIEEQYQNIKEEVEFLTNDSRLNTIKLDGSGNKYLNDKGEYSELSITEEDILNLGFNKGISQIDHGTSDTTYTLSPNTFHVWDVVQSLDLTLGEEEEGIVNEYMFQFSSGETATTLMLPDTVKWINEFPDIEPGMTYQCSIINNIGIICGI